MARPTARAVLTTGETAAAIGHAAAHGAIDRAIALAPDVAIYANFKQNLPHIPAPDAPAPAAGGGGR